MTKQRKRRILGPPRNQWESALEETGSPERTQAGEFEPGNEEGGGGDKGIDADTGDGGYAGDAVMDGHDEAAAQPERPVDREIHGDPRTREGDSYPDETG